MQSTIFEPQNLPQLPQPDLLSKWVFESPLPLSLVLLAIGIIIIGALRHTDHAKRIGIPSLVVFTLLAISVFLVGRSVTTDREHLKARSTQLVIAAAAGDQTKLTNLLDQRVEFNAAFASVSGRDSIITLAKSRGVPIISSANAKEVNAGLFGQQVATTQIKVKVEGDMIPPNSWWTVEWTRPNTETNQWVVTHIEPIWIQGFNNPSGSR